MTTTAVENARPVEPENLDVSGIPGVTAREVHEAVEAVRTIRQLGETDTERVLSSVRRLAEEVLALQAETAEAGRTELFRVMSALTVDPVPWPTVRQIQRLTNHRRQLLASGAFTTAALQAMRGDQSPGSTRTWVARQRERGNLFTVDADGSALVPAFLLDTAGTPRPQIQKPLRQLLEAGLSGWELWTWFSSSSPWLGARSPADCMESEPEQVATAAEAFVANLA